METPTTRNPFARVLPALLTVLLLGGSLATAGVPQLWLYPDSDDPRQGGHVVSEGAFTLMIANWGAGNGDLTAYGVELLLAVREPELVSGGALELADGGVVTLDPAAFSSGIPTMPCTGATVPPAGTYPAPFIAVPLGDLPAGTTVAVAVDLGEAEGLEARFDAVASGIQLTGQGDRCTDVVNPPGHGVSVSLAGDTPQGSCPDLELDKTTDTNGVGLGEELTYTLTVTNVGACDVTDALLTEDIPALVDEGSGESVPAFTVVATDPAPTSQSENEITWQLNPLAPEASTTVAVTVLFDIEAADGMEVENTACVQAAEMEEPACDAITVAVGETPADDDEIGGPGFWCNRIRFALAEAMSATYTVAELDGFLTAVDDQSAVFSEMADAATPETAVALLCRPQDADGAPGRLLRHLLTLWLNVFSERLAPDITLGELCPGGDGFDEAVDPAMTVAELIAAAEAALLEGADDAVLTAWMETVDRVNSGSVAGEDGCLPDEAPEPTRAHRGYRW